MKKIAFFALICCAMIFTGCNRAQQTYYTTTEFSFSNSENVTSVKAVLGTINLYWNGDYTFNGNDEAYTDLKAAAKYGESIIAILAHGNEIKTYMSGDDYFVYNLYRKSDNQLLESTKFFLDEDGDLDTEEIVDNVEDGK
ncbi:MAG: hypothetical protein K6A41_02245 [Bacteroidales bacterium]|nr:hypothetical protein [Bacteroidales bacterium]